MNRIAAMTIIRGNGECQAYWNGVVMEEMRKMNERHALEVKTKDAELDAARSHRNALLRDQLAVYRALNAKPVSAFRRLREALVTFWCVIWGLGEHFGLWEYAGDDER